jgi:serine/threonine protein phosphatase PrpC
MSLRFSTGIITQRGQRDHNQDAVFHYAEVFSLDFLEKYTEFNERFLVFRSSLYDAMKRIRSYEWLMKERPIGDFGKKFPVIYKLVDQVIKNAIAQYEGQIHHPEVQDRIISELEELGELCVDLPLFVKLYGIQLQSALLFDQTEAQDAHKVFETDYRHEVFSQVSHELRKWKGLDEVNRNYLQSDAEVEREETRKKRIKDAIAARGRLFAVADGVAGSHEGHFASRFVTKGLRRYYEAKQHIISGLPRGEILKEVIEEIDDELSRRGQKASGTTLTAALIEGNTLWVSWVGDTEAYLIRPGEDVRRFTPGHGEVSHEEARQRFVSYMGQGLKGSVHLEPPQPLQAGDRIVIASDGLTRFVTQKRIKEIVCTDLTAQEMAEKLAAEATPLSDDNITAIVITAEREGTPLSAF